MFMEIAISAIGIGIVLMVGYLVIAQVRSALVINNSTISDNGAVANITSGLASTQSTVFAGFGLVAVGIIVLAAFGLIQIFQ